MVTPAPAFHKPGGGQFTEGTSRGWWSQPSGWLLPRDGTSRPGRGEHGCPLPPQPRRKLRQRTSSRHEGPPGQEGAVLGGPVGSQPACCSEAPGIPMGGAKSGSSPPSVSSNGSGSQGVRCQGNTDGVTRRSLGINTRPRWGSWPQVSNNISGCDIAGRPH